MNCIETRELSYSYSKDQHILHNLNITVPESAIYGFLGPNGAGKTTTLRLLLGLLRIQNGSISIFGQTLLKNRVEIVARIGSLIESPSIYAHLTATENLLIQCKLYGCNTNRINEVLKLTGLGHTNKKRAGQFSLGMKQRLSIAIALLQEPSLLILDEPTNGLDPNGIIEMRDLLKEINTQHGVTILVSSHLLSEVEKLVSHVGIIHKGNLLFQGTQAELKEKTTKQGSILFDTGNIEGTFSLLQTNGLKPKRLEHIISIPFVENEKIALINKQLIELGIPVYRVSQDKNDLESIFMEMVNN